MKTWDPRKVRNRRLIMLGLLSLAWFVTTVDDWSRDLFTYGASLSDNEIAPDMRPWRQVSAEKLEVAVEWAGRRILDWEYIGTAAGDGNVTLIKFVRTHRLLRIKDDIIVRVEDRGDERIVSGESRSRFHFGDLGRNPRNLRRVMAELRDVVTGARGIW